MEVFTPAVARSTGSNLARTLAQTTIFWLVFIGLVPLVIVRIERGLDVASLGFAHQTGLGLALGVGFGAINLWSGVALAVIGRGTPFPTQTARELVVTGPYRHLRNPMAFGGLGVAFALGLARGSWGTMAYAIAGGVIWHVLARPMEERDLAARFGASYHAYRAAVRCWWPRLRPYRSSGR
jgi:protein-S-isoprenylcysteine O-methyltransferase Ste14